MANTIRTTINIGGTLDPSVQSAFSNINKFASSAMNKMASLAKKAALATSAMAVVSGKAFAEFEQSAANVSATMGKSSTPEIMEDYKKKAIELSDTMSKSSKEVMDGFNYLALAGWNSTDSLNHIGEIVQSSIVGNMDLATCSDKVTDSLSALGLVAEDTTRYTNTLALAQSKGNATMENLLDSYLTVGGTIKNYNIPLNESTAILDKLADRGLKGSEAGNSLSAIFVNLMGKTGQAKAAMDELGVSLFDSSGKTKNMSKFLFELKDKLSGMTEEQRNTYISMIAGKNQLDAFNKLMDSADENLIKLTEDLKDTDGSLDAAAKTIDSTILGNLKKLKNIFINTGIEVISKFAPNINNALEILQDKLKNLRPKIEEFADNFIVTISNIAQSDTFNMLKNTLSNMFNFIVSNGPQILEVLSNFVPIIVGIGSAMVALKIAGKVQAIIGIILKLKTIFMSISFAFQAVAGGVATFGEGMAFLMGPVGWIIAGIAAVIAIGTLLYMKCEGFRNFINSAITSIVGWFQDSLLPAVQNLANSFMNFWNSVLWPFIQWLASKLAPMFIAVFSTIQNVVSTAFQFIGNIITNGLMIFQGVIDFITGVFTGNWSLAWQGCIEIFSGIFNTIVDIAKTPINYIIDMINGAISGLNSIGSISLPDFLGGGSIGINIPQIPQFADGGFTSGISIAGEDGPEAVIPLKRNNPRSLGLLQKTSEIIGGGGSSNSSGAPTFVFSPQISGEVTPNTINLLTQSFEEFKEMVNKVLDEREREAYG